MKTLMILALATAQPGNNCPDDPEKLVAAGVLVCSVKEARKLEPSGETADVIADAVASICAPIYRQVNSMYLRCRGISLGVPDLADMGRPNSIREIVQMRASLRARAP